MKAFTIFCFICISQLFGQELERTSRPKISIISTDVVFIKTIIEKSNSRPIPGSDYVQPVVTYSKNLQFDFRFSIFLYENNIIPSIPLDIKLTSQSSKSKIFHIEEKISDFVFNEFYYYQLDILTNEIGWFTFEIGEFKGEKDITYDKQSIYFKN